jgi:excisionase family DNA binding protein
MTELSPEIREAIAAEVARQLPPRHEEYLTAKEAALVLRCHAETVLRMARDGKITSVGSGKLLRIVRSSIDAYLTREAP